MDGKKNGTLLRAGVLGDGMSRAEGYGTVSDAAALAGIGQHPVTAAEVEAIVRRVLSELRVYVLESDITQAQNAVRGVVEQSYF